MLHLRARRIGYRKEVNEERFRGITRAPRTRLFPSAVVRYWLREAAFVATLLGCDRDRLEPAVDSSAGEELYVEASAGRCSRPELTGALGDLVSLDDEPPYRCRLRFRETGIVLRGDSAGGWPDPGENVARDSRGRFFTSVLSVPYQIAVWNPDGTFSQTLGRLGQGPGELPKTTFAPLLFVDAGDSLRVRSQDGAWSIWGPDLRFVRRVHLPRKAGGNYNHYAWVGDGVVIAAAGVGDSARYFTFASGRGQDTRMFAPVTGEVRALQMGLIQRSIVASGDTAFWASPVSYAAQGYALELWSPAGKLIRTYRRHASWFPDGKPVEHFGRELGSGRRPSPRPEPSNPQPRNVDGEGFVMAYVWVQNDRWTSDTTKRLKAGTTQNLHLEVIDPLAGEVVASERVSLWALLRGAVPKMFFPGTRLGYYVVQSNLGIPEVHVVEYMLLQP
jgi:hypothetical protein